jgi:transposase
MLIEKKNKQLNIYSAIYSKIPKDHLLKRIDAAVDFDFVNELLKDSYCAKFGRPAKEPEMMMRLLFLQYLYCLSDVRLIEEANCNLAYLWFLGLNPDESLPDASLLAKFRTQRLKEHTLDDVLSEIVKQCAEKGLIKGKGLSTDTTHIGANCVKKTPERIMKHLARKIFAGLEKDVGDIPEGIDTEIPDYESIEDHKEAKAVMKRYLEETIEKSKPHGKRKTEAAIAEAEKILGDEKFIMQTGVRSLVDKDARVGHKSKRDNFFGYKCEISMTTDERIITAVQTKSGEYKDGTDFNTLLDRTLEAGFEPEEVYGDKAYFRKDILERIQSIGASAYIPLSTSAYKIDEELFSYNKDSDQWFCVMGHGTVSKKRHKNGKNGKKESNEIFVYSFDKEMCVGCARRSECMGKSKTRAKLLRVSLAAPMMYEYSQRQKQPEFLEKYKNRSCSEWKNGEMKRFHGMSRARGFGLASVTRQTKLTAIAVNLKRIAALIAGESKKSASKAEQIASNVSFFCQKISSQITIYLEIYGSYRGNAGYCHDHTAFS